MDGEIALGVGFEPAQTDVEEITRSSVDYIESWYTGDGERMQRCLHPDLAKRGIRRDPGTGELVLRHIDASGMVSATAEGRGTVTEPANRKHHVTILDVFRNIACTKVVSYPYVDYLHLARSGPRWLIVNVLWEPRRAHEEQGETR